MDIHTYLHQKISLHKYMYICMYVSLSLSLSTSTRDSATPSLAMLEVLAGQDREESRRLVVRALDAFLVIVCHSLMCFGRWQF